MNGLQRQTSLAAQIDSLGVLVCNAGTGHPNAQSEKAFQNGIDIYPDAAMDWAIRADPILFLAGLATGCISGQGLTMDGGGAAALHFASLRH